MSPSKSLDPALHLELGDFYISKEEGKSLDDFRKEADENLANVQREFEQMFKDFKADNKAKSTGMILINFLNIHRNPIFHLMMK